MPDEADSVTLHNAGNDMIVNVTPRQAPIKTCVFTPIGCGARVAQRAQNGSEAAFQVLVSRRCQPSELIYYRYNDALRRIDSAPVRGNRPVHFHRF
jgi:hypothetical protein